LVTSDHLQEKHIRLEDCSDEQLVEMACNADSNALDFLISKYKPLVRLKVKSYFLIGADKEDIVQEGMIGLYKAVRDFNGERITSFKAFAELCVRRQIITAIKAATRQKHIPLNSYVSLDKPVFEEESSAKTLMDMLSGATIDDPEKLIIHQEEFNSLEEKIGQVLSDLERQVLTLYLEGRSYQEISASLDRHVKSIDNALQRIKRKLERHLEVEV